MPPKKAVKEEKILLGRPSNNLKIAAAENYPFCTIDPEESRVAVPDARFDWLVSHYKPASRVPAYLTIIDIAGLVKGAASGAGLGNAFLSHIRAVDGIFHMVRAFSDPDVIHVEGEIDPVRDMEIIHEELRLKDIEFLNKQLEQLNKVAGRSSGASSLADKAKKEELDTVRKLLAVVEDGKDVRKCDWSAKEVEIINPLGLLTAKPVIYLVNLSEKDYIRKKNKWLPKIKQWIDEHNPGDLLIPYSAGFEQKLINLPVEERETFIKEECGGVQSNLNKIIVAGYQALQLVYFFTGGADEVRAWTIRKFTKAPQAAGTIHTDFERGFVMAEVMKYDDLKELGGDSAVKAAGKYNQKGKEYVVEDGDIIYFKFNVTSQPKKK